MTAIVPNIARTGNIIITTGHRDQFGKFYSHAIDYRLQPDQRLGRNVGDDHRNELYRGEE